MAEENKIEAAGKVDGGGSSKGIGATMGHGVRTEKAGAGEPKGAEKADKPAQIDTKDKTEKSADLKDEEAEKDEAVKDAKTGDEDKDKEIEDLKKEIKDLKELIEKLKKAKEGEGEDKKAEKGGNKEGRKEAGGVKGACEGQGQPKDINQKIKEDIEKIKQEQAAGANAQGAQGQQGPQGQQQVQPLGEKHPSVQELTQDYKQGLQSKELKPEIQQEAEKTLKENGVDVNKIKQELQQGQQQQAGQGVNPLGAGGLGGVKKGG